MKKRKKNYSNYAIKNVYLTGEANQALDEIMEIVDENMSRVVQQAIVRYREELKEE